MSKLTEKEMATRYEKLLRKQRRNTIERQLLAKKAKAAGIKVSEAEIDERLALVDKKK